MLIPTTKSLAVVRLRGGQLSVVVRGRRNITNVLFRGGAAVVGMFIAYLVFNASIRFSPVQVWRIGYKFRTVLSVYSPSVVAFPRPIELAMINDLINGNPTTPIVITGPRGSGKSSLVNRAISGRPNTMLFDLRAHPVPTGEAFAIAFLENAGYLFPPSGLIGRAVFARDMATTQHALSLEVERGLQRLTTALVDAKKSGWTVKSSSNNVQMIPPVIVIGDLSLSKSHSLLEDPYFKRIVEWIMYATDQHLCHVVFTCCTDVSDALDLNKSFRFRRQRVYIDFANERAIREYFMEHVNPFLYSVSNAVLKNVPPPAISTTTGSSSSASSASSSTPTPATSAAAAPVSSNPSPPPSSTAAPGSAVTTIVAPTGLEPVSSTESAEVDSKRGPEASEDPKEPKESKDPKEPKEQKEGREAKEDATGAKAEKIGPPARSPFPVGPATVHLLQEWEADRIASLVGGSYKDLEQIVSALARGHAWQSVVRRLLTDSVEQVESVMDFVLTFADEPNERQTNIQQNMRDGASIDRQGQARPIATWNHNRRASPERLAAYQRFLRLWMLMTQLSQRKHLSRREATESIFAGCPQEIDFFVTTGLFHTVTSVGSLQADPPQGGSFGPAVIDMPGGFLCCSSRRTLTAIKLVTRDENVLLHVGRVKLVVQLAILREEDARLTNLINEASIERTYWQTQVNALVVRDTALRTAVARELVALQAAAPVTGSSYIETGSIIPEDNKPNRFTYTSGSKGSSGSPSSGSGSSLNYSGGAAPSSSSSTANTTDSSSSLSYSGGATPSSTTSTVSPASTTTPSGTTPTVGRLHLPSDAPLKKSERPPYFLSQSLATPVSPSMSLIQPLAPLSSTGLNTPFSPSTSTTTSSSLTPPPAPTTPPAPPTGVLEGDTPAKPSTSPISRAVESLNKSVPSSSSDTTTSASPAAPSPLPERTDAAESEESKVKEKSASASVSASGSAEPEESSDSSKESVKEHSEPPKDNEHEHDHEHEHEKEEEEEEDIDTESMESVVTPAEATLSGSLTQSLANMTPEQLAALNPASLSSSQLLGLVQQQQQQLHQAQQHVQQLQQQEQHKEYQQDPELIENLNRLSQESEHWRSKFLQLQRISAEEPMLGIKSLNKQLKYAQDRLFYFEGMVERLRADSARVRAFIEDAECKTDWLFGEGFTNPLVNRQAIEEAVQPPDYLKGYIVRPGYYSKPPYVDNRRRDKVRVVEPFNSPKEAATSAGFPLMSAFDVNSPEYPMLLSKYKNINNVRHNIKSFMPDTAADKWSRFLWPEVVPDWLAANRKNFKK